MTPSQAIAQLGGIAALVLSAFLILYGLRGLKAYLWSLPCPPPQVRPEGACGAYEEPQHVKEKREAYVARQVITAHDREVAEHRQAMAGRVK